MRLVGIGGGVFEFSPRSYEFAHAEDWDANWLIFEAVVETEEGS